MVFMGGCHGAEIAVEQSCDQTRQDSPMTAIFSIRANCSLPLAWLSHWRHLAFQFVVLVVFSVELPAQVKLPDSAPPVLLILPDTSAPYSGFLDGFAECNRSSGDGQLLYEVKTIDQVAAEPPGFGSYNVVGVGTRATKFLYDHADSPAFSASLLPAVAIRQLLEGDADLRPASLEATFVIDQPISRRLALVRSLLPKASTLGVVFGPDSGFVEEDLRQEAKALGFALNVAAVASEQDLSKVVKPLLDNSDGLLLIYDPVLTSPGAIRFLLYSAYRRQVPVIGYSEGYVRAGAVAAVHSSPEALGCQVAQYLSRKTVSGVGIPVPERPLFIYPFYYQYRLNETVAQSLGVSTNLVLPDKPVPEEKR